MSELSKLPWVVEYCTLHFLVGDSLNYGFDKDDQPMYFEWVMDLFDVTRFFCALAVVSKSQYQQVIDELTRNTTPPLDELGILSLTTLHATPPLLWMN